MNRSEPDRAGFVEVNRTRLRVWEWGDAADPVILCAHGAHDHGRMWDGLAPRLAALGYRVVAPDLRGHGDSGRLAHGHAWAALVLDFGVLAAELGPPVGLVGHSFGGGIATFAAGVWPERFRWLVNIDGLGPPEDFAGDDRPLAQAASESLAWSEKVLLGPPKVFGSIEEMVDRRAQTNVRLPRPWVEHLVRHGSVAVDGGWVWKADPAFRTGLIGEFDIGFFEAEWSMATCPVLVLTGAEPDTWSDLSPPVIASRLAMLGDPRHQEIADAGHYVHIEAPDATMAAIAGFLAEVGP